MKSTPCKKQGSHQLCRRLSLVLGLQKSFLKLNPWKNPSTWQRCQLRLRRQQAHCPLPQPHRPHLPPRPNSQTPRAHKLLPQPHRPHLPPRPNSQTPRAQAPAIRGEPLTVLPASRQKVTKRFTLVTSPRQLSSPYSLESGVNCVPRDEKPAGRCWEGGDRKRK